MTKLIFDFEILALSESRVFLPASGVIKSFDRIFHKPKYSDHILFGATSSTTHATWYVPLLKPDLRGEH